MHALTPTAKPLFSGYIQDLTPAQARWVESYALKIRRQMSRLLERCAIEIPAPSTSAMGRIRTSLTSLDLTLEDIHPDKLHGYGKMDAAAAHELSCTLQETRGLVGWLLSFLSESAGMEMDDLGPAGIRPGVSSLCKRLVQIATDHGLVEFMPALHAIYRESRRHSCDVAVIGKNDSGKSSLINMLVDRDYPPSSATSLLGLPVRVSAGLEAALRTTFPDHTESNPLERFTEFAGVQENPGNIKRVAALDILIPSKRLQAGYAFIEETELGAFAGSDKKVAAICLPDADVALVLVGARSSVGTEETNLLRALSASAVPTFLLLSRCDLLATHDIERRQAEVRKAISGQDISVEDVVPIGVGERWKASLDDWFEKVMPPFLQRGLTGMTDAVEHKARSVGRSMLSILEPKRDSAAGKGGAGKDAELDLWRLDDSLEKFCIRWEDNLDAMSAWDKAVLDRAASSLAAGSTNAQQALTLGIVSQCCALVEEYQELHSQIRAGIGELQPRTDPDLVLGWELPEPERIPLPLASLLRDVPVSPPGALARINQSASARHYRKELEEKAGSRVKQVLDELQPRFRHWFHETIRAFRESYRMQTDPVRYRNAAEASVERNEKLAADIDFLRSETT